MTSQQILQSDMLDILFEGRNKAYGAYLLRKTYPVQLVKAIGITLFLVLLLLFFGQPSTKQSLNDATDNEGIIITQVALPEVKPELPKPKVEQAAAAAPVKTEVFTTQIELKEQITDPVTTQDDLSDAVIGSDKIDGPAATGSLQPLPLPQGPPAIGTVTPEVEKTEPLMPSRQPQFPGGTDAWLKFLGRHLTPPSDLEAGEKRSVLIRFSVDEEGAVTNFAVVQSGGADFDAEVIRVLKKMPRWLPAIQQGKPVAVSFTQPVTFVAPE